MKKNKKTTKSNPSKKTKRHDSRLDKWEQLTWDALEQWVGSRTMSRGRTYQRQARVDDLVLLPDGGILASVEGSCDYVVKVHCKAAGRMENRLDSTCSCPVGISCKHAVASIVELLDILGEGETIPEISEHDARLSELDNSLKHQDHHTEYDPVGGEDKGSTDKKIRSHIQRKSHQELADWIWLLTQRFPEVYTELREHILLQTGKSSELIKDTRRVIQNITAEPAWKNHWDDLQELPNYAPLQRRLERLLESGLFDELVELGEDLFHDGIEQVEESHDEGETAMALGSCMAVVFQGLAKSSLSASEKLLHTIDADLQDGYGILEDATDVVFEQKYPPEDWSQVADVLSERIVNLPRNDDDFSRNYRRDQMSNWLSRSLEHAGRSNELRSVYEQEARTTGSYTRLVRYLIDQNCYKDATDWANEGIKNTADKRAGIASSLVDLLMEIAQRQKQWNTVGAYIAWRFFSGPSLSTFKDMLKAATKARCKTTVQKQARDFLETGTSPLAYHSTKQGNTIKASPDWPLPIPDVLVYLWKESINSKKPHHGVLLDIALDDKKNEEALHWYDKIVQSSEQSFFPAGYGPSYHGDRVAEAVAASHPARAMDIYHQKIQSLLPHADQRNYSAIGTCLRKMKPIYKKLKRENDWQVLVDNLRTDYRRRPKFVEVLSRLEGSTILQNRRKR